MRERVRERVREREREKQNGKKKEAVRRTDKFEKGKEIDNTDRQTDRRQTDRLHNCSELVVCSCTRSDCYICI